MNETEQNIALPPEAVAQWTRETVGTYTVVSRYAHDHDYSELWRLRQDASGDYLWLKCHRHAGKWAGEVYALKEWTQNLGLSAPRLLGFSDEPRAVLLSEVAGAVADSLDLDDRAEHKLWYAAGEYLRTLHTLENEWFGAANPDGTPQGEPHQDAEAFVRRSIETRITQGVERGLFDTKESEFIGYGAREWTVALRGETPRAIHRDYSPRNWMADESGTLHGVIDFEHARWDVRAADLNRWWDTTFVTKPHLAEPFFDGYQGGPPSATLRAQIQAMRLLGAAAGVVWATGVGDTAYAEVNRAALHRLMSEPE